MSGRSLCSRSCFCPTYVRPPARFARCTLVWHAHILPCHARFADAWSLSASESDRDTSDRFDPLSSGAPAGRRLASSCDGECDSSCNGLFGVGSCDKSCDSGCDSGCPGCGAGKYWKWVGGLCDSWDTGLECEKCSSCSSGRYRAPCSGDRCGKGAYYSGESWYTSDACGSCVNCEGCVDGDFGPRKRVGCGGGTGGTDAGTCDSDCPDSDCPQCPSGQYASSSVQSCQCKQCPNCEPGKYRDKCGTLYNDRGDKGTCKPCDYSTYKSVWSNENSCPDTFPTCGPGEYLVGYSASSSGTCTACPAGKFKDSESVPYNEQCEDCRDVNPGQYLDGCGGSSGGTRTSCPANEYQPDGGYYITACKPCAPCAEGEHRVGCGDADEGSCTPCPLRYLASSVSPDDAGAHCCVAQLDYLQDTSCTPARHAALLVRDCTGLVMPPPQPPPPFAPPPPPSPPPPAPCVDTDNGATDSYNDGCVTIGSNAGYDANPQWCHSGDDNDFTSGAMCCACGGGILQMVSGRRLEVGDDDDSGGGASGALSSSPTSCKVGCQPLPNATCNGAGGRCLDGALAVQTRYETDHVPSGQACQEVQVTKTCTGSPHPSNGVWSDDWDPPGKFEHCLQGCTDSGGATLAPGAQEARTAFSAAAAPVGTPCSALVLTQHRTCPLAGSGIDAAEWEQAWEPAASLVCHESCASIIHDTGVGAIHGETVAITRFRERYVPPGASCERELHSTAILQHS